MESRILDLPNAWEYGLIEGCRGTDLKELKKNNKIFLKEIEKLLLEIKTRNLKKIKSTIKNTRILFKGISGLSMNYYVGYKYK